MRRSRKHRGLFVEPLENRSLMAADCHNLFTPLDVNDDNNVTPADALKVINQLNVGQRGLVNDPAIDGYVDVTDDGQVTPSDAIKVINWLNSRDPSSTVPDSGWTKVDDNGNGRLGAKLTNNSDGSVDLEIRVQNAAAGQSHPVFMQDRLIGNVQVDDNGRGVLKLSANSDLASRLPELLLEGQTTATLEVDSVASVDLKGEGERNSNRSQENRLIAQANVFTTSLVNTSGERRGEVVYGARGEHSFLGVFARGLTAGQSYDVTIDGVVVGSLEANAGGIVATRILPANVSGFPTIATGSKVTVGDYTGELKSLKDRIQIPQNIYVANLTGNRVFGGAEMQLSEDRTVIRLLLARVESNTTFDLSIDGIKIAEVTSGRRGVIEYRFDSKSGSTLLADLPTLTADSVISVGTVASGKLVKITR